MQSYGQAPLNDQVRGGGDVTRLLAELLAESAAARKDAATEYQRQSSEGNQELFGGPMAMGAQPGQMQAQDPMAQAQMGGADPMAGAMPPMGMEDPMAGGMDPMADPMAGGMGLEEEDPLADLGMDPSMLDPELLEMLLGGGQGGGMGGGY